MSLEFIQTESLEEIQTDEIHNFEDWEEYYDDTKFHLDDESWYEIYMSGYGEGQRVTKKSIIREIDEMMGRGMYVEQIIQELKRIWEVK